MYQRVVCSATSSCIINVLIINKKMFLTCYANQVEGNISGVMTNYYCEITDVVIGIGIVFLFLLLIIVWKKILWS